MACAERERLWQEARRLRGEGRDVPEVARMLGVPSAVVGNALQKGDGERDASARGPEPDTAPATATTAPLEALLEASAEARPSPRRRAEPAPFSVGAAREGLVVLQRIEEAAWEQWTVSCRPRFSVSRRTNGAGEGESFVTQRTYKPGDARFLNIALRCFKERERLRCGLEVAGCGSSQSQRT